MKRTRRQVVNLGVGTLVSTSALGAGRVDVRAQTATPTPAAGAASDTATPPTVLRPEIDLVAAQETALEGHTGATVRSLALESENGVLVYEVELSTGAEVTIDATTGEIVEAAQSLAAGEVETGEDESGEGSAEDENSDDDDNGAEEMASTQHATSTGDSDAAEDEASPEDEESEDDESAETSEDDEDTQTVGRGYRHRKRRDAQRARGHDDAD